jgi:predicted transcriptional regulator
MVLTASELRHLLKETKLRQYRFAAILGRSPQIVSDWVNGRIPVPGYAIAFIVAYRLLDQGGRDELHRLIERPEQQVAA